MQTEQVSEAPEQQQTLTPDLVKDLVELIAHNNIEVRHGTISAILQYTPTPESKLLFKDTNLLQYLRKYVFEPKLTTICLSTLIHFATEAEFAPQYFPILQPLVLKLKEWDGLELQLALLLLLNLSKEEEIITRLLMEEDKKGYLMEILWALLEKRQKTRWILVGIFVNVSAFERGRRFLVQEKMAVRFVQFINSFDQKLREAGLKILRNCSFQYEHEPFIEELFKPQYSVFPKLAKLLVFLIWQQELIHDLTYAKLMIRKLFDEGQPLRWQKQFESEKSKAFGELQLGIDVMLVLSNVQLKTKDVGISSDMLKELLGLLKYTEIKEETKDKLQALQIFGL